MEAFQSSALGLSTHTRREMKKIVIVLTRSMWGKPHKISDDKFILAGYYFLMIETCCNPTLNLTNLYSISGH